MTQAPEKPVTTTPARGSTPREDDPRHPLQRLAALFDPVVRQVVGELGNTRESPADHAREKLGWVPRPATWRKHAMR